MMLEMGVGSPHGGGVGVRGDTTRVPWGMLVAVVTAVACSPAGGAIVERMKLTASDAREGDLFGSSVAIENNTVVIGATQAGRNEDRHGVAYLFDTRSGQQLQRLSVDDTGSEPPMFGSSVAIDDQRVVVGVPADDGLSPGTRTGSVYVFDRETGERQWKLVASDGAAADGFGRKVALAGNRLLVGAPGDDEVIEGSGSAYVVDLTTGEEIMKMMAGDPMDGGGYGFAVAVSGDRALVGASGIGPRPFPGSAYIHDLTTGEQLLRLAASDGTASDGFGAAIAVDGNLAVIGAPDEGSAAYVFDITTGEELHKIDGPPNPSALTDEFGGSVAIDRGRIVVGAEFAEEVFPGLGAAYVYDAATGERLLTLLPSNPEEAIGFGRAVAIEGNTVVVSAVRDTHAGRNSGAVFVFVIPEPSSLALAAFGLAASLVFLPGGGLTRRFGPGGRS